MTDNLLTAGGANTDESAPEARAVSSPATASKRPQQLPDKFWDEKAETVRLDALIKSYLDLERKLSSLPPRDIPDRPEDYTITLKDDLLTTDPEVNKRLHQAGFSREQAQLVYELACDHLLPMISELAVVFDADNQLQRLDQHFGGKDRWREVARQIDAWGRTHLPRSAFEALASTYEGVIAMHRMMTEGDEPGLMRDGLPSAAVPTDDDLRTMMRDPRYWRDQDPAYVGKVREGFRRLYQDQP
ncbi:MAG: hypothetical protein U1E42_00405 [Rhodospirillales bacterium]